MHARYRIGNKFEWHRNDLEPNRIGFDYAAR